MPPEPKPTDGAAFQANLAAAVSNPAAGIPPHLDGAGIAVYRRLLHNNIASFLTRCFSDSIRFADPFLWQDLQNRFLAEAKPHSPYFKDIPAQFLAFAQNCNSDRHLPENVLAMMAFEADLLHAETALQNPCGNTVGEHDPLCLSESVRLKTYPVDFISSGLQHIEEGNVSVLSWRNLNDETCYQALDDIDAFLLQHFGGQDDSISALIAAVHELTGSGNSDNLLRDRLAHWLAEGVLTRSDRQAPT